jgi:UDP-glucose 4-epimerase
LYGAGRFQGRLQGRLQGRFQIGTSRSTATLARVKILVTGGAGYLGSVTSKALEAAGHVPVVLDSLLTGPHAFVRGRIFYEGDVGDRPLLARIVEEHPDIEATVHMAARIVVPESVVKPYEYYRDNVSKSLELFDALVALGKPRVLFSSSGSIYARTDDFEVSEDDALAPSSPYGRTKRMVEEILHDLSAATELRAIVLRYFNPVGSDPDLESGSYDKEPTHVLGQLIMAARGEREGFTITGTDLPTRDGTGMRDYLHVWDLARAHVRAVERFDEVIADAGTPSVVLNVGRGDGVTVRELLAAFERVTGRRVSIDEAPSRPGDAVGAYANADRARELLGWQTELSLDDAIASALAWADRRHEVLGYA